MMVNVDIMDDASEVVHYDKPGIPLYIRRGALRCRPFAIGIRIWS